MTYVCMEVDSAVFLADGISSSAGLREWSVFFLSSFRTTRRANCLRRVVDIDGHRCLLLLYHRTTARTDVMYTLQQGNRNRNRNRALSEDWSTSRSTQLGHPGAQGEREELASGSRRPYKKEKHIRGDLNRAKVHVRCTNCMWCSSSNRLMFLFKL